MTESSALRVAALLACYNRKQKTLKFLESLASQSYLNQPLIDIYLLDDGSTDGTAAAVQSQFPFVNIVTGTGSLYWVGGMIKVWEQAIEQKQYDFFLLLNDDVVLFNDTLQRLMHVYKSTGEKGLILIGSTADPITNQISYGGNRLKMYPFKASTNSLITPDTTKTLPCLFGNANIMLIDSTTVNTIGIFSKAYQHLLADFDYTFRANKAGLKVLIAPGFYGYCENDNGPNWLPAKSNLKKRIKYLYHPLGLEYKAYLAFVKKYFPLSYPSAFIKLWIKTLFPIIWDKFKKTGPAIESSNNT